MLMWLTALREISLKIAEQILQVSARVLKVSCSQTLIEGCTFVCKGLSRRLRRYLHEVKSFNKAQQNDSCLQFRDDLRAYRSQARESTSVMLAARTAILSTSDSAA